MVLVKMLLPQMRKARMLKSSRGACRTRERNTKVVLVEMLLTQVRKPRVLQGGNRRARLGRQMPLPKLTGIKMSLTKMLKHITSRR